MPIAVWMGLGIVVSVLHIRLSQRIMTRVSVDLGTTRRHFTWWWYGAAASVGVVTASRISTHADLVDTALLLVTASLMLVQAPLDAVTHRLSRSATLAALGAVGTILVANRITSDESAISTLAALSAVGVAGAYLLVHVFSSRSIGFGDVLIVMPLSLAVGALGAINVLAWQTIATTTGALQVVTRWKWRKNRQIAFGPHLLGAAWLVLVASA